MKTIFRNRMKSIASMAWMLVKKYAYSFADAMRKAWAISKLKTTMHGGVAKFIFDKLNGERRLANGTLSAAIVPPTGESGRKPNDTLFTYWDCDKQSWRSFKVANFVGLV